MGESGRKTRTSIYATLLAQTITQSWRGWHDAKIICLPCFRTRRVLTSGYTVWLSFSWSITFEIKSTIYSFLVQRVLISRDTTVHVLNNAWGTSFGCHEDVPSGANHTQHTLACDTAPIYDHTHAWCHARSSTILFGMSIINQVMIGLIFCEAALPNKIVTFWTLYILYTNNTHQSSWSNLDLNIVPHLPKNWTEE